MQPHIDEHTVFIVDDDAAVCDALGMLLRAAGMKVETYRSAVSFLKKAHRPDHTSCLLLDIRMPGISGLDLQDELRKRRIPIPIVFLTGHGDVPMAVRALKKGAFDFIEKPHEEERLVLAVLNALRMDENRRKQANRHDETSQELATRLATLSDREREVLDQILDGKPTRRIADELRISVKTVEFHRARIREKLGVASLPQLFRLFIPPEVHA